MRFAFLNFACVHCQVYNFKFWKIYIHKCVRLHFQVVSTFPPSVCTWVVLNTAWFGLFLSSHSYIQSSAMKLHIPFHTFPCIITLHIYLTEVEAGFGYTGWRKLRRFTPMSSSSILILSLSLGFVVQQEPINAWCISIVLWRYSHLHVLVVKLPAHCHTKTIRITENHNINKV